jgi:SAM-dependent methyltransferase
MRLPFRAAGFDCVVNLFTSIGYFEEYTDNFLVFENVNKALKPEGIFVVDFFNATKVKQTMKPEYIEQRGDITFNIRKNIENNHIVKKINFEHHGKKFSFEETVSLLYKSDFEKFAAEHDFKTENCFGDYELNPFNENVSERLILIFRK